MKRYKSIFNEGTVNWAAEIKNASKEDSDFVKFINEALKKEFFYFINDRISLNSIENEKNEKKLHYYLIQLDVWTMMKYLKEHKSRYSSDTQYTLTTLGKKVYEANK